MLTAVENLGTPFLDDSSDLYSLDKRVVVNQNNLNDISRVKETHSLETL